MLIKVLEQENQSYRLLFATNTQTNSNEFIIKSVQSGKHKAVHTRFALLSDDGSVIEICPITESIAQFIIDHFDERGDTESFNIYQSDLKAGNILYRNPPVTTTDNIVHQLTHQEKSYTSTGAKLEYHWPIFQKYKETGFSSIIRATMTNHQVCSSHCQYCSTISRNKKDSITLDEAKRFVETLYFEQAEFNQNNFSTYNNEYLRITGSDIRLRGLILSGGGQPNLWPFFVPFVEWLSTLSIDLGLITNGFPKHLPEEIYTHFKWIRISITPAEASPFYPNGKFENQYIPKTILNNKSLTVGFSYVYGTWSTNEELSRIDQSITNLGFDYCRILIDCNLPRFSQLIAHKALSEKLTKLQITDEKGNPLKKIFHQLKYHGTQAEAENIWEQGQCFLQLYNVFWDTTGHEEFGDSFCYPCDSVTVLTESAPDGRIISSERKFNGLVWGTVRSKEVGDLFKKKTLNTFDPRHECTSCLFMKNNLTVKALIDNPEVNLTHSLLDHINFP